MYYADSKPYFPQCKCLLMLLMAEQMLCNVNSIQLVYFMDLGHASVILYSKLWRFCESFLLQGAAELDVSAFLLDAFIALIQAAGKAMARMLLHILN